MPGTYDKEPKHNTQAHHVYVLCQLAHELERAHERSDFDTCKETAKKMQEVLQQVVCIDEKGSVLV